MDAFGNIVAVGYTAEGDYQSNNWIVRKYGPDGNLLWSREYNSPADNVDSAESVAIDRAGNIVVAGVEYRDDLNQSYNWLIRKYDPNGGLLWSRDYNCSADSHDGARGVTMDINGNIVVVGYETRLDLNQGANWLIRKYDPGGNLLWSRDYNSAGDDRDVAYAVAADMGGNIVVAGVEYRDDLNQGHNWCVRKYDSNGGLLWSQDYDSPAGDDDAAVGVAVDLNGDIVAVGWEYRPDLEQGYNWLVRKYACMPVPTYPFQGTLRVFPNPYIRSRAVRGTVKFEGLDLGSRVRVYTVRGLLVWEGTVEQPYILEWNGSNAAGKPATPGTYLWVAESGDSKQRGTLVVE